MSKSYTTLPDEQSVQQLVHELEVAYGSSAAGSASALGSQRIAFWEAIRSGISQAAFERIRHHSPFSDTDWAGFLDISTKSLHRYRQDATHRFKPGQSETILEVAELCTLGLQVLGSPEAYMQWLRTPSAALAGEKPQALVGSSFGHQLLMDELTRMDQGIFA
jgi:putative toxin-antitoxin system antitoxin component (TIGR02293 family)